MDVTEKVDLVSRPPTEEVVTQDELLEISGVGAKKATQYGDYFLSILKNV